MLELVKGIYWDSVLISIIMSGAAVLGLKVISNFILEWRLQRVHEDVVGYIIDNHSEEIIKEIAEQVCNYIDMRVEDVDGKKRSTEEIS